MRARLRSWFRTPAGRARAPWRLLLVGLVAFLANVAVGIAAIAAGAPLDPTEATGRRLAAALGIVVVNGIAVTAVVLLAARYLDRRLLSDLGWRLDGRWWTDLVAGGALGVGLVGTTYAAGLAVGVYDPAVAPAGPSGFSLSAWLAILAGAMVAVGVYEELLLRGYVLTNLAEGLTALAGGRGAVAGAVALSSLGFGLLHGLNPSASGLSLATITLAGVMLGLGYVCTGSLALPTGIHMTWNLSQVLLGLPVSGFAVPVRLVETAVTGDPLVHGGSFGPEGGLLGLGTALLGCLSVVGYARLTGRGFREEIAVPALRT